MTTEYIKENVKVGNIVVTTDIKAEVLFVDYTGVETPKGFIYFMDILEFY